MKFIGIAILVLAASVLIAALPDLREMDRKDEYFRGCMLDNRISKEDNWEALMVCNAIWYQGRG